MGKIECAGKNVIELSYNTKTAYDTMDLSILSKQITISVITSSIYHIKNVQNSYEEM